MAGDSRNLIDYNSMSGYLKYIHRVHQLVKDSEKHETVKKEAACKTVANHYAEYFKKLLWINKTKLLNQFPDRLWTRFAKTRNPFRILRSIVPGEEINDLDYLFLTSTLIPIILKPFFPPLFKLISLFEN